MCAMSKPPIAAAITRQPSHGERRRPLAKSTSTAHTTARIDSITTRRTGAVCAASPCRSGHSRTQWLPMIAVVATPIVSNAPGATWVSSGKSAARTAITTSSVADVTITGVITCTASVMSTRCASTRSVSSRQPVATPTPAPFAHLVMWHSLHHHSKGVPR